MTMNAPPNGPTRIIGLAGWSGSGKTTLITRLIPRLIARGIRVSTPKHAHHGFDLDQPGKDSFFHRTAGATEVIISSAKRWACLSVDTLIPRAINRGISRVISVVLP